mgnify:CR=1 FL=1
MRSLARVFVIRPRRRTRRAMLVALIVGLALAAGRLAIYAAESMGGWRGG